MAVSSIAPTSTVAANVRAEAARQSFSQSRLAEELGMNQPAISRRLTGKVDFSASELSALASLFGVPVATLFASAPTVRAQAI